MPKTQWSPQEQSERRNPTSNQWDFHRDDTEHGQPKCTGDTEEYEKAQEWIKKTIEKLYKHQSETKNTINRQTNELRTKIDNIKEEVIHDMENLRKKSESEMQTKCKATPAD
jgi:hypothetical protein